MKLHKVKIENFRLLRDVELFFEERTTLIVGRNNSGKTSVTELFRRLFTDTAPSFKLEDFSLDCHAGIWRAFTHFSAKADTETALSLLPTIRVTLDICYDLNTPDLGALSECIIDLDPNCTRAQVVLRYEPSATALEKLFVDLPAPADNTSVAPAGFFQTISPRIASAYSATLEAVDPGDAGNRKPLHFRILSQLLAGGFINAQRGLDDETRREKDVLGKVVELLFLSAMKDGANPQYTATTEQLKTAVSDVQQDLQSKFGDQLNSLLPTFELFGYPGLSDPGLTTETHFDIERILSDHTKVRYTGAGGMSLPETYNGLGVRNLIYILLQLFQFFRNYKTAEHPAGVHVVFIEEPEAHLHPQMQEVFIRQLSEISQTFARELNDGSPWPVQFVVTTHSPHMANEARFESIRYFLSTEEANGVRHSIIKDFRHGLDEVDAAERDFLHQYLTLTRCDLFFADKAVLIEGTSERLLLPTMIRKGDETAADGAKLGRQYLTVMEVGGAYAHRFFGLLNFLELRALVITDIDSVRINKDKKREAAPVADSEFTSNGCLKEWFGNDVSPAELIQKTPNEKSADNRRVAYQIPEQDGAPCARSFEDAFILANPDLFVTDDNDKAQSAYDLAAKQKKSSFALKYAIEETNWVVPRYIDEGLKWLAQNDASSGE